MSARLTFSTASPLPTGLTLGANGTLSGTPTQSGSFPITVVATDANGCTGTGPTYTLVISCQTITVTNPVTTSGTANVPFSQTFTQSGGFGTTTFSTARAPSRSGLTLAANGVLSGTPTQAGTFPIVVVATDANGCTGSGATYTLVITCQTITVTNPACPTGTAGAAFSQTFTQAGAIGTADVHDASSTLPAGLFLAANGVLSGTPTQTGTFPIVVTVTDGNLCTGTGATYTLVITCQTITVRNPATTIRRRGYALQPDVHAGRRHRIGHVHDGERAPRGPDARRERHALGARRRRPGRSRSSSRSRTRTDARARARRTTS